LKKPKSMGGKMNTSSKKNVKSRGIKLKHPIPYHTGTLETHLDIIKAYVIKSREGKEPVSYKDLEPLVPPKTVSGNNKFFEDLGLIRREKRGNYLPTELAIKLSHHYKLGEEEKVKLILREIVLNSWFWNSTKELLDFKDSVTKQELVNKLCSDSGADPHKDALSLNRIIEYMAYSQLLEEEDENFKLKEPPKIKETIKSILPEEREEKRVTETGLIVKSRRTEFPFFIGLLVTPKMSEEQIRKAVRILLNEIRRAEEEE